ncbi:hypothetical protein F5Y03DRAFT_291211 [Xylaria venustula]|nr:hypothetical protein F5Y03DRAFT_291211 [Xylaria venustula]
MVKISLMHQSIFSVKLGFPRALSRCYRNCQQSRKADQYDGHTHHHQHRHPRLVRKVGYDELAVETFSGALLKLMGTLSTKVWALLVCTWLACACAWNDMFDMAFYRLVMSALRRTSQPAQVPCHVNILTPASSADLASLRPRCPACSSPCLWPNVD